MIVDISVRLDYDLEEPTTILLQIEAAPLPDQRILRSGIELGGSEHSARVPAEDGVGERSWVRADGRFACTYVARVEIDRPEVDLQVLPRTPLHELPGELAKYLMDSRFIAAESFQTFVDAEFGSADGGARIAAMRDWIESRLSYVAGSSDAETTAADTFIARQGVCRDYAHLMVCLARFQNPGARRQRLRSGRRAARLPRRRRGLPRRLLAPRRRDRDGEREGHRARGRRARRSRHLLHDGLRLGPVHRAERERHRRLTRPP